MLAKIIIKNYLKDHRVFMTSIIAALSFGGLWKIHDKDSIQSSFPDFLKIINKFDHMIGIWHKYKYIIRNHKNYRNYYVYN